MDPEQAEAKRAASVNAGVPLGGVGAGCIEMGRDGRLRNITINNNRLAQTRIPVSRGGFLAARAVQRGRVATRILQADSDVPFQQAGIMPPYAPVERIAWRGLYPRADYQLNDPQFPVEMKWTGLSPIVPYDVDASTLPVVFFSFTARNLSEVAIDVTTLVNWENLCGCAAGEWPDDRGTVRVVLGEPVEDRDDEAETETVPPGPMGLEFGVTTEPKTNAQGHYCLLAHETEGLEITVKGWDHNDPDQLRAFWEQFHDEGRLDNAVAPSRTAHSGAVCCSFTLPPRGQRQVVHILSWYCPRFVIGGVDQGNGYTLAFPDAKVIAKRALRYWGYFFRAVGNWHDRILSASLPRWFNRMLINDNYVFSTNTVFTRDGKFALFETPEDPWTGALDRRFHSSLSTLLFFPALAYNEIDQFAKAEPPDAPGRLYRYLGRMCVHQPSFGHATAELLDLNAKFVLMVYRDYHLTGRTADLRKLYPRLKQIMLYMVGKDRNGDGLPDGKGYSTTYDGWTFDGVDSYSGSIWIAAIWAFGELARRFGTREEAAWCDTLFKRASASFERRLWNEVQGYYHLHDNPGLSSQSGGPVHQACAEGQLAGQWYADFLGLGCLFPPQHIRRALRVIFAAHEQGRPLANWPAFHATHYACLEIRHGNVDVGLHSVQKGYKAIHVKHGRTFNQPLCWDVKRETPSGWGVDRHMSAPSMWHVLFALQGFLLNVPEKELWLRPNLPRGVHMLRTPLFTPVCLGWFVFQESDEREGYRQFVQVSFDSPVQVQTVVLKVPVQVKDVEVHAEGPDGADIENTALGFDGDEYLLELQFKAPVTLTEPLQLAVTQTKGDRVEFAPPGS